MGNLPYGLGTSNFEFTCLDLVPSGIWLELVRRDLRQIESI